MHVSDTPEESWQIAGHELTRQSSVSMELAQDMRLFVDDCRNGWDVVLTR